MKIFQFNENEPVLTEPTVLVLGYFDGLHKGHQALFTKARELAAANALKIAVLTFPEKPTLTFEKFEHEMLLKLTSDAKRDALFAENGVDLLYYQSLSSKFSSLTAHEFEEKVIAKFNPKFVVTGFDHKTGHDMRALTSTAAYKVIVIPEITDTTGKISSTRIREAIKMGAIRAANQLLGYDYEISGLVVHGFARGREIGYPTANLVIKDYVHVPSSGVYVVDVLRDGARLRGFASIGVNETFDAKDTTIEVHIFDFNAQIYGENLTVLWLDKLRDMVKFDGIDALLAQMKQDEMRARNWKK
ncbi:MAG: bifunctional riboflavin kinase/FAD synthetase [Streptococcaceae bacterium]|jgi:riboflavin kinase/FMN adenylyltransferase|nr:bifunctional riboflavin kinase/FAD synthetase [Streptococcaceae bacterium]